MNDSLEYRVAAIRAAKAEADRERERVAQRPEVESSQVRVAVGRRDELLAFLHRHNIEPARVHYEYTRKIPIRTSRRGEPMWHLGAVFETINEELPGLRGWLLLDFLYGNDDYGSGWKEGVLLLADRRLVWGRRKEGRLVIAHETPLVLRDFAWAFEDLDLTARVADCLVRDGAAGSDGWPEGERGSRRNPG